MINSWPNAPSEPVPTRLSEDALHSVIFVIELRFVMSIASPTDPGDVQQKEFHCQTSSGNDEGWIMAPLRDVCCALAYWQR